MSKPIIPTEYLTWLQATKCANVDLFGLEPKHGSAAKLHSIYVPLTTSAGAEDVDEGIKGRRGRQPARGVETPGRDGDRPPLLLDRLADESLYVPGAPGSGKSTFCRWVAWLACEGRMPAALDVEPPEGYRETWPAAFANRLPVLVRLREAWHALLEQQASPALARADLEAALARWVGKNTEGLSGEIFLRHLARGTALVILDGVDEVPVSAAEDRTTWSPRALLMSGLMTSCRAWMSAGNRILVTSRPHGVSTGDAAALGIPRARVHDLDPSLRGLLVRRWFQQLRSGGERKSFADGLIGHLAEHDWLEQLSANPLLLTGMCIVYDEGGRLPQDKHDLYTRIVNTVLNSRYRDNVEEREKARYRLQAVAFGMHTGHGLGETRTTPVFEASLDEVDRILSDYLEKSRSKEDGTVAVVAAREELLSQSGLFLGSRDNKAGFYHPSFQEFLAGQRIADVEDDIFPVFRERAASPDWHNTLSLLFAGQTRERAARLVKRMTDAFPRDRGGRATGLQIVAADCLDILSARGVRVDKATERTCRDVFLETMVSNEPTAVRCRLGSTLGRIGDPRFHDESLFCLPRDPTLGFIDVPAGTFIMGSDEEEKGSLDDERPRHAVELPRFWMARYPTTVAQFSAFVTARKYERADPRSLRGAPNHPVTMVSWHDAMAYCRWLTQSLRASDLTPAALKAVLTDRDLAWQIILPSEAEWERAARGTGGRRYPWGDAIDPDRSNYGGTRLGATSPVGAFPRGATPRGEGQVEDLSGNVWERTRSLWGADVAIPEFGYPYDPDDPKREDLLASDSVLRVVRGGSFGAGDRSVRAARRLSLFPAPRHDVVGFRVVVSCSRS